MKRSTRIITFALAVLLGAALALWMIPKRDEQRALHLIASDEQTQRDRGWRWMLAPTGAAGEPRAASRLEVIHNALHDAPDAALLDAADRLRRAALWAWETQPLDLSLREMGLRAAGDVGDQRFAAEAMLHCPLDADPERIVPIVRALVHSDDTHARHRAFEAACAWLGRARAHLLREIALPHDDDHIERMTWLALSWANDPGAIADPFSDSPDVLEAQLLHAVRAQPHDASHVLSSRQDVAIEYVLRHSEDERALRELQRLAREGREAAAYALQARLPSADDAQSRRVLADPSQEPWRRRLAAWRWDGVSEEHVFALLKEGVTEPDGSVYAAALLAERRLSRKAASGLAEESLRDFNDDRKRAGALLAASLGEHAELLEEAMYASAEPQVRTIMRIALDAIRGEAATHDPVEFAWRALHQPDGDFDPDVMLCLLLMEHRDALNLLVERPRGSGDALRRSIQQRAMLIERFVPAWNEDAGRPIGGELRAIHLHFDWLRARRLLERRADWTTDSR